ncbi:hypothetical protein ACFYE9_32670 [Rhizobium leguminosarum]|uniref:Uncharacterized protein n=2 Tax=Rhizobium leguminosarum TaxID=384 RepID=A0A154IDC1_RHILE|nr:hypothetical protein [Rhizobium leguminosarum]KZA98583.1 hypothetical protein A4A59_26560 [Rhizobium leguminosarum]
MSALGESYDALQAQVEVYAEGDPVLADDGARLAEIERTIESIQNTFKRFDPLEMALAGCIVTIDHAGDLQIGRGYVKPDDRAALDRLRQGATKRPLCLRRNRTIPIPPLWLKS